MKKLSKTLATLAISGLFMASLAGCSKPEGPAEKAGKAVDSAVDKTGQQIEKAGEKIQNLDNSKSQ